MGKFVSSDTETLLKGTYRGDSIFDVAEEDPEYLENLVENHHLEAEEQSWLLKALGREEE